VFTVPSQVTFAAGSKSADIVINCDVEKMGLDTYHPLTLSFADGVASPYGDSSYTVRVCIAGNWIDLGMCTYNDPFVMGLSYEVPLQESETHAGYYRLKAPYGSAFKEALEEYGYSLSSVGLTSYDEQDELFLYVHAEDPDAVYLERQALGVGVDGAGELAAYSYAGYAMENDYTIEAAAEKGWAGSVEEYQGEANGYVYFGAQNLLYGFEDGAYANSLYYANQSAGVVLFSFPGVDVRDYSSTITFDGVSTTTNALYSYGTFTVQASSEVEDALFGVMKIEDAETDVEGTYNAMLNGSIETYKLKAGDSKSYEIELEGAGKYCAMVLGYANVRVNGEYNYQLVDISYKIFTVRDGLGTQHNFKHLGTGYFQDGWLYPGFSIKANENIYEVEVYESKTTPGVYRVMNPYGLNTEIGSYYNEDENDNAIEIDASDKEFIVMLPQYSGLTSQTLFEGEFYIGNIEGIYASAGYSSSEALTALYKKYGMQTDKMLTNYDADEDAIIVQLPLFGYDAEDQFGYNYNTVQEGIIWLPIDESASAPAKFKKSVKRVERMVNRTFGKSNLQRIAKPQAMKTFKLGKKADLTKI
jgi:hypothetical protein